MPASDFCTTGIKMGVPCTEQIQAVLYETVYEPEENLSDRFRVVYIESGAGTCSIDGTTYPWIGPCLICLNERQRFTAPSIQGPVRVLYFNPNAVHNRLTLDNIYHVTHESPPEVIENTMLFMPFTEDGRTLFLNHVSPELAVRVRFLLESIERQLTEQETAWWPCLFRSYLTELLVLLSRKDYTPHSGLPAADGMGAIQALKISADFAPILEYVMNFYCTELSLDDLAREFGTNRTSLNKHFKEETGMTAIAYVKDLRLRIASAMLVNTYLPVSEIAERTGIGDVSYFERIFRVKYGQTPTNYRSLANG